MRPTKRFSGPHEKDDCTIYDSECREVQLEDDEMSHEEACFMQGYEDVEEEKILREDD